MFTCAGGWFKVLDVSCIENHCVTGRIFNTNLDMKKELKNWFYYNCFTTSRSNTAFGKKINQPFMSN